MLVHYASDVNAARLRVWTIKMGPRGAVTASRSSKGFQTGGFAPLPHIHRNEDESFYVLEGRFAFRVGMRQFEREAGAFVHVPPGHLHGFMADFAALMDRWGMEVPPPLGQ